MKNIKFNENSAFKSIETSSASHHGKVRLRNVFEDEYFSNVFDTAKNCFAGSKLSEYEMKNLVGHFFDRYNGDLAEALVSYIYKNNIVLAFPRMRESEKRLKERFRDFLKKGKSSESRLDGGLKYFDKVEEGASGKLVKYYYFANDIKRKKMTSGLGSEKIYFQIRSRWIIGF